MSFHRSTQIPLLMSPSYSTSSFSTPSRLPTPPSSPIRRMADDEARQPRGEVLPCSPQMSAPPTPAYGYPETQQFASPEPPPKSLLELAERGDFFGLLELLSSCGEAALQLTERGDSALHVAASRGHMKAVIVLVGVIDVNTPGFRLRTPLHHAALNGHVEVAIRLLDFRARIDAKDASGLSPLAMACKNRHTNLVHKLLTKKAKIDGKAIAMAAENGCWNLVNTFLHQSRGLANVCSDDGHPILVLAAKAQRWITVKLLLKKGAYVTKCKSPKESALFYATKYRQGEIIDLLMRKETKYNRPQLLHALSHARASAQKRKASTCNP